MLYSSGNMLYSSGNILAKANGSLFSTFDQDFDSSPTTNCAQTQGGGWWWNDCDVTGALGALNANYSTRGQWLNSAGNFVIQTVEMKIKRVCIAYTC